MHIRSLRLDISGNPTPPPLLLTGFWAPRRSNFRSPDDRWESRLSWATTELGFGFSPVCTGLGLGLVPWLGFGDETLVSWAIGLVDLAAESLCEERNKEIFLFNHFFLAFFFFFMTYKVCSDHDTTFLMTHSKVAIMLLSAVGCESCKHDDFHHDLTLKWVELGTIWLASWRVFWKIAAHVDDKNNKYLEF